MQHKTLEIEGKEKGKKGTKSIATSQAQMWNYFSVPHECLLKTITESLIWVESEDILIMCRCCKDKIEETHYP